MTSLVSFFLVLLICVTICLYTSIIIRLLLRLKKDFRGTTYWREPDGIVTMYTILLSVYVLSHNLKSVEVPENVLSPEAAVMIMIHIFLILSGLYLFRCNSKSNSLMGQSI